MSRKDTIFSFGGDDFTHDEVAVVMHLLAASTLPRYPDGFPFDINLLNQSYQSRVRLAVEVDSFYHAESARESLRDRYGSVVVDRIESGRGIEPPFEDGA